MANSTPFLEPGKNRTELVVVLHGFSSKSRRLADVRRVIRDERPDADIFAPELPDERNKLCRQKAESIVAGLVRRIDAIVSEHGRAAGGYRSITLVGHSFGAVLARKIAIVAFGEQKSAFGERPTPFEPEFDEFREPRPWAKSIRRIVLLAGMNRGWSVSSAMDWLTTAWWSVLQFVGETILRGELTIFAIRKGAPFLVQTRLQWLSLMDPSYGLRPDIVVVQLLGTGDDLVSPDDNVDYSVDLFGDGERPSYFYIEVKQSDHDNVVEMSKEGKAATAGARSERRDKFLTALEQGREGLTAEAITREQMSDNLPPKPDPTVTDLVFVVHGIRDKGFWTQKIARAIKRRAAMPPEPGVTEAAGEQKGIVGQQPGRSAKFESWTESYGYFAMLPFMLRSVRQRKVEWLMDRYAEARARYPRASFHFVGHSNGTYLAAKALDDYPAASFKHVVFAGSVVRRDYDWLRLTGPERAAPGEIPRVRKVLNYVATRDWVVALFPKGVQRWRRFNLGSAGHDGFDQASLSGPVYQVTYIVGSHGAGHEEPHWDGIARFIVTGNEPQATYPPLSRTPSRLWRYLGAASFILFPLGVALILAVGVALLWPLVAGAICAATQPACTLTAGETASRLLGFFAYLWIVYLFITRF